MMECTSGVGLPKENRDINLCKLRNTEKTVLNMYRLWSLLWKLWKTCRSMNDVAGIIAGRQLVYPNRTTWMIPLWICPQALPPPFMKIVEERPDMGRREAIQSGINIRAGCDGNHDHLFIVCLLWRVCGPADYGSRDAAL